jgi:hypothetical protein
MAAQADDQPVRAVSPYSSDYTSIQRYYSGASPTYQLNLPGQVVTPGQVLVPGQSSIILTQPVYPLYPQPLPIYPRRPKVTPHPRYPQQRFSSPQQGITFPSPIIPPSIYLYGGPKYPYPYYQPYPQRPFPSQGYFNGYPANPGVIKGCWYTPCYPQNYQRKNN